MEKFLKKVEELQTLLKIFMPSIKTPKPTTGMPKPPKVPGPEMHGMAPNSKKDPAKIAEQIKNAKSKQQIKISSNGQWNMDKADEQMFHLYDKSSPGVKPQRITSKPMKLKEIHEKHGKDIESKGYLIKPHNPLNP